MANGGLAKLTIESYKHSNFDLASSRGAIEVFKVMFNPEKYARNYKVQYEKSKGQAQSAQSQKFKGLQAQSFEVEFTLDATGVAETNLPQEPQQVEKKPNKDKPPNILEKKITQLLNMGGKIAPKTHRPHYLKVYWGSLLLRCVMDSMNVNYTLFDSDGSPLRATVRLKFLEVKSDGRRVNEDGKNSPDLTHIRTMRAESRLDYMTYEIYRDNKYYLQVAKFNDLDSYRRPRPGLQIKFPPLINEKKKS